MHLLERQRPACLHRQGLCRYFHRGKCGYLLPAGNQAAGPAQIELELPGYHQYWNYAEKKGYSGTAVFSKQEPLRVSYGLGIAEHDKEGRVITLEFPSFYLVTVYTPNSQDGLARIAYRLEWEAAFRRYLCGAG